MTKEDLRIVFMGTPDFAVATLRAMVEGGWNVVAVVTQPDRPVGRHAELTAPAVKRYALERGIPVLQPEKMKDEEFLNELASYEADLQVVVAFRMLPEVVWSMPRWGTFNVHASLLPKYRGAAPINWAIIRGETLTGVTTFMLDKNIDTGKVILQKSCPITDDADAGQMYDTLKELGAGVAIETLELMLDSDGHPSTIEQDSSQATSTAPKLNKDNCQIDWGRSQKEVHDFIRGLSPMPGAWTRLSFSGMESELQEVKVYKTATTNETCREKPSTVVVERRRLLVATSDHWLELTELQLAGKRRMTAMEVINGLKR